MTINNNPFSVVTGNIGANTNAYPTANYKPAVNNEPVIQQPVNAQMPSPSVQQPVLPSQPQQDSYVNNSPNNSEMSFTDIILKYSGLAAVVVLPVAAFVTHKSISKNAKALENSSKVIESLQNQIAAMQTSMNDAVQNVQRKSESSSKMFMTALGGALSGLGLGGIASKIANDEEIDENDERQISETVKNNVDKSNDNTRRLNSLNSMGRPKSIEDRYQRDFYGFQLLDAPNLNAAGAPKDGQYYAQLDAQKKIADGYLSGVNQSLVPLKRAHKVLETEVIKAERKQNLGEPLNDREKEILKFAPLEKQAGEFLKEAEKIKNEIFIDKTVKLKELYDKYNATGDENIKSEIEKLEGSINDRKNSLAGKAMDIYGGANTEGSKVQGLDNNATTVNILKAFDVLKLDNPNALNPGDSVWFLTSECDPVKEGGLGSVPPELQDTFSKFGLNTPMFLPAYKNSNGGLKRSVTGQMYYEYADQKFNVDKIAELDMPVYRNGRNKDRIEFYLSEAKTIKTIDEPKVSEDGCWEVNGIKTNFKAEIDPVTKEPKNKPVKNNKNITWVFNGIETAIPVKHKEVNIPPMVFVNDATNDYFKGTIYSTSSATEEAEKFAVLDKAVYEFLKVKVGHPDGDGIPQDFKITDKDKFDSIKAPKAMVLNDWHTGPFAALCRYKAPIDDLYNQNNNYDTISDMKLLEIVHNGKYQGETRVSYKEEFGDSTPQTKTLCSNILNTLFEEHAFNITNNAHTGAPYIGVSNSLVLDTGYETPYVNFLNTGTCLVDFVTPVSSNYAQELTSEEPDEHNQTKAGSLLWAFKQRNGDFGNSLSGIVNGSDLNVISLEKNIKSYKDMTGVDFTSYNKDNSIETIMDGRFDNKCKFFEGYIKPIVTDLEGFKRKTTANLNRLPAGAIGKCANELPDELFNSDGTLNKAKFEKTPVFALSGRLVEQKGADTALNAIKNIFDNWEEHYPDPNNRPEKPIIYISGADGEGGRYKSMIQNIMNNLSDEDAKRIIYLDGFAPSKAHFAAADFMLMPSKFEPCGLTQLESLAQGTPVVATATGGIYDTINMKDADGNVIKTGFLTPQGKVDSDSFTDAIWEALDYFNEDGKTQYKEMVQNAVNSNYNWIQPGKKGSGYKYLSLLGGDINKFPDLSDIEAKRNYIA